jgi:hypothetical protein
MEQDKEHSKIAERAPFRLNIALHWRKPPDVPDARSARLEALVAEIERLSVDQRAAVARGLAMLWQGFVAKFDGLDGFFERRFEERAEYLRELESGHETMSKSEALADSRYSLSPSLMSLYVEALSRRESAGISQKFGRAIAGLIEQGDELRALTTPVSRGILGACYSAADHEKAES